MNIKYVFFLLFLIGSVAPSVQAKSPNLTGDNVLVLYKESGGMSKKTADYYAAKRAIPSEQLVPIKLGHNSKISRKEFKVIQDSIADKLTPNIKVIVLAWHDPIRVECMSMTSAFTFGFDEKFCSHTAKKSGCRPTADSPYYNASADKLWETDDLRLTIMLGGRTFDDVKNLIDRGVAADDSEPTGTAYLVRTHDKHRSVRHRNFKSIAELWPEKNGITLKYVDDRFNKKSTLVKNKKDVMFYMTGLTNVPDINTNTYLPGAIADHLTSFGGSRIEGGWQMSLYRWLEAGATGSYGTVIEPCAFTQKFPNASILIPSYLSGDTLVEAYWKSVQQPGEGIFVGEPLARPWSREK